MKRSRKATSDLPSLDVRQLNRDGLLTSEHEAYLEWTPGTLGGRRPWFRCPECDRRVELLYVGEASLACRHCLRLVYACQWEEADDRAMNRADEIRQKLGWEPGIARPAGGRPKWMPHATFEKLKSEYAVAAAEAFRLVSERLGRLK